MDGDKDELEELFQSAADFVGSNSDAFDTTSLLYLYARFKQVKVGSCNTPRPGFFDFQGKSKWDAWQKLGNMKKCDAMREYVTEVTRIRPDWESQFKNSEASPRKPHREGFLGVAVSTMVNTDQHIEDEQKTVFDWCKEGNTRQLEKLVRSGGDYVDIRDSEGMALLHWACDRGDVAMVTTLLKLNADVNIQDGDSQTPLHFAVICEHPEVVNLLIQNGAKMDIKDTDGQTVLNLDTSSEIQDILSSYPAG